MSIQTLIRCGVALFLAALASGCASTHHGPSSRSSACRLNPSSCMYNGQYEPGERGYAEDEAKKLNNAESRRLGW